MIFGPFTPYIAVALLAGLTVSHTYVYFEGRSDGTAKYEQLLAAVEQAEEQATLDAARRKREADKIIADVSSAWERALADSRAHPPVVRVQPAACSDAALRSVPPAEQGIVSPAAESGLGREVFVAVEECESRLNAAAQDAAQVLLLIQFINQQHEASQ